MGRTTFAVVSLGLIGGSLAGAIRKKFPSARVIGFSRNPKKIALAKRKKYIHEGYTNVREVVRKADLIFICAPVHTIPKLISLTDQYAKPHTIVTDVGSTKAVIANWADRKHFRNIRFVGSHPLAGSHLSGLEHAQANLFQGAFVFVTPTRKSDPKAVRAVSSFWRKLGGRVQKISPDVHDQIVSEISHLPHAVTALLIHAAEDRSLRFAASGFLDTTRIAQGDPKLWIPIFLTNRRNLLRDLSRFSRLVSRFSALLKSKSRRSLEIFLKQAARRRFQISSKK
ncbi:MAG: prephenate dehydrogenase [Candidatus Omnitrophica bacterium]|nr:prephenate dehydrogenase [Candidatus Omnitrophota bacterium]